VRELRRVRSGREGSAPDSRGGPDLNGGVQKTCERHK